MDVTQSSGLLRMIFPTRVITGIMILIIMMNTITIMIIHGGFLSLPRFTVMKIKVMKGINQQLLSGIMVTAEVIPVQGMK